MKKIPLNGKRGVGLFALIDDEDFELISSYRWNLDFSGYAVTYPRINGRQKTLPMHRLVMGEPKAMQVDHINRNKLDNRKSNLRLCTHAQNMVNVGLTKANKSGYKGVRWNERLRKWQASIRTCGKPRHLGLFDSREAAALSYNIAASRLHGEFAWLNPL